MRLHDRYLFRELLVPLGFCLGGFLIFWIAFDLFGRLDDFQELKFGLREILFYYLLDLPKLLNTALPVALLLAMLYALSAHSRHNELIALRSAGLSLWRICVPRAFPEPQDATRLEPRRGSSRHWRAAAAPGGDAAREGGPP